MRYLYLSLWVILSASNTFSLYEESIKAMQDICKNGLYKNMTAEPAMGRSPLGEFMKMVSGKSKYKLVQHDKVKTSSSVAQEQKDLYTTYSYMSGIAFVIGHAYSEKNSNCEKFIHGVFKDLKKPNYLENNIFNKHINIFKDYIRLGFNVYQAGLVHPSLQKNVLDSLIGYRKLNLASLKNQTSIDKIELRLDNIIKWLQVDDDRVYFIKNTTLWNISFDHNETDTIDHLKPQIKLTSAELVRRELKEKRLAGLKLKHVDAAKLRKDKLAKIKAQGSKEKTVESDRVTRFIAMHDNESDADSDWSSDVDSDDEDWDTRTDYHNAGPVEVTLDAHMKIGGVVLESVIPSFNEEQRQSIRRIIRLTDSNSDSECKIHIGTKETGDVLKVATNKPVHIKDDIFYMRVKLPNKDHKDIKDNTKYLSRDSACHVPCQFEIQLKSFDYLKEALEKLLSDKGVYLQLAYRNGRVIIEYVSGKLIVPILTDHGMNVKVADYLKPKKSKA